MKKGANIEAKDYGENTPLHIACLEGQLQIVEYLIEKGAHTEAKDNEQKTPIPTTSLNHQKVAVKYSFQSCKVVNSSNEEDFNQKKK